MTTKKLTFRQKILVAGTLFGMFFGAGNLIFPVHLGQMAGRNAVVAMIGFIITAVGIPIFGVAAIGITHSDGLQTLSSKVGKGYGIFFTCLLYLTIGPLFAIPRCATVSFTTGIIPLHKAKEIVFSLSPKLVTEDEFLAFAEIARHECEDYYILGGDELYTDVKHTKPLEREIIDVTLIGESIDLFIET